MSDFLVSPSQISSFAADLFPDTACQRKWAFEKIEKIRTPSTPKQAFGTKVHKHTENWLTKGIRPDTSEAGEVAAQGIAPGFFPTPQPGLLIENEVRLFVEPGLYLRGYADCIDPVGDPSLPVVKDFKTTTDPRWAKKETDIGHDPQSIIYPAYTMQALGRDVVQWEWIYLLASCTRDWPKDGSRRKPKGRRKVGGLVKASDPVFQTGLANMKTVARQIRDAKAAWTTAQDAPPNSRACEAFGGCPHRARCGLSAADVLIGHLAQYDRRDAPKMETGQNHALTTETLIDNTNIPTKGQPMTTLFDQLKASLPTATTPITDATTPAAPASPPERPAPITQRTAADMPFGIDPPEVAQAKNEQVMKIQAAMPVAESPAFVETPTQSIAAGLQDAQAFAEGNTAGATVHHVQADPVAVRQAELEVMTIAELKELAGALKIKKTQPKAALVASILAAESLSSSPTPGPVGSSLPPDQASPVPAPQRNTVGEAMTVMGPGSIQHVPAGAIANNTVQFGTEAGDDPSRDFIVLFDCTFRKRPKGADGVIDFAEYIEPVAREVAAKWNVDHFGLIDYAKGPPELAAALERKFLKQKPTGIIVVDSASLYGRACKDVLIRYAKTAVQAVR